MVESPERRTLAGSARRFPTHRRASVAAAVGCLVVAGYLAVQQRDQSRVRTASELGGQRRYAEAFAEAGRVSRSPAVGRALLIRARAAQALGRHREAVRIFRRAAGRDPRSWSLHRDWAMSLLVLGERRAARDQLELATALNPRMSPPAF